MYACVNRNQTIFDEYIFDLVWRNYNWPKTGPHTNNVLRNKRTKLIIFVFVNTHANYDSKVYNYEFDTNKNLVRK